MKLKAMWWSSHTKNARYECVIVKTTFNAWLFSKEIIGEDDLIQMIRLSKNGTGRTVRYQKDLFNLYIEGDGALPHIVYYPTGIKKPQPLDMFRGVDSLYENQH